MNMKRIIYVLFLMLLLGCNKKNEKPIQEEDHSFYKISQAELSRISESSELTNAVQVLTIYDVDGVVPDVKYFSRIENLNVLTKKSVDTLVICRYVNNTCKRIYINNGISDGDAEKTTYGDVGIIEILPSFLSLQYIKIYDSAVEQIKIPEVITSLQELEIKGSSNISDTSFLRQLPRLEQLYLDVSGSAATVLSVGGNPELQEVNVSGNLESFDGLDLCKKLRVVVLRDLPNINMIPTQIPNTVERVVFSNCNGTTISIVALLASQIREIYIFGERIVFRDEDVKDYGDREINFEGEKAIQFFRKYIKKDDESYMTSGEERFMVGQTKYTVRIADDG